MNPSEIIGNFNTESNTAESPSLEGEIQKVDETDKPFLEDENQKNQAFDMLNTMRKRDLFCDVTLKVEGGSDIRAHRSILASCSPYFYEVFTNLDEREQQRIKIQDIQHSTLEQLIDYIYTSKISITEENVKILYQAAKFLKLTYIRDTCCEFMKSQLKPSNCFEIQDFADNNGCEELLSFTNEYVEENFWRIIKQDGFLALTPEKLSQLISSDHLAAPAEETIFESVISWLNFDLEDRKKYLVELIEQVRMPLLSRKYLVERVEEEPLIQMNSQCQHFLIKAMKYYMMDDKQKILPQTTRTKHRQPRIQSNILLVVGSWNKSTDNLHDECYDFEKKKWYQVSEPHPAIFGTRLAVVEGRVYKIGDPDCKSINVYDPFTGEWSKCRDMITRRGSFGVAVLDNCIYVVGGSDDNKSLNKVEIYDPRQNEWQIIPSMLEERDMLDVGVVNGFLYAIGGYDWKSERNLSSAERYDPEKKEWESIADMSTPRRYVGVGVIDGILYAVGGTNGESKLRSVEAYNPATNEWKLVAEMSKCREDAGVIVYNGMLYVVGGHDGTSYSTSVEVFSPTTNSWTTLPSSMNEGRYSAGVAIVDKLRAPLAITLD